MSIALPRPNENTCGNPFARCHPGDLGVPWPAHQGPSYLPGLKGRTGVPVKIWGQATQSPNYDNARKCWKNWGRDPVLGTLFDHARQRGAKLGSVPRFWRRAKITRTCATPDCSNRCSEWSRRRPAPGTCMSFQG